MTRDKDGRPRAAGTEPLELFRVRTLTEEDVLEVIQAAGGRKAHPDADRRDARSADFVLGEALIELKALDDEGFSKPERQRKLAELFKSGNPDKPVIVLDRSSLARAPKRSYDRIVEGPIKTAVASARKQLAQSRAEITQTTVSILLVINNGYAALDHDRLVELVAHRVRQDTSAIDGVVVAGCYYYSDGFDSCFLWPVDYVPINLNAPFTSFPHFREAWNRFADAFMTDLVRGSLRDNPAKYAVIDTVFDVDGTTFVKPAPPMGKRSDFYVRGRPRRDSSGLEVCPPVALVFPGLTRPEWHAVRENVEGVIGPLVSFEEWQAHREEAITESAVLQPLVTMSVTASGWLQWCDEMGLPSSLDSLRQYAHRLFEKQVHTILEGAREQQALVPSAYVLSVTEEIGQDRANDVSHLAIVREGPDEADIRPIAENLRIFHEHAVALAAAYAVEHGIGHVRWKKDLKYAWI